MKSVLIKACGLLLIIGVTSLAQTKTGKQPTQGKNTGAPLQNGEGCYNDSDRFVECGLGIVRDTRTGLIWLKNPVKACFTFAAANPYSLSYQRANNVVAQLKAGTSGCDLDDGSTAGMWRLPTKAEWESLLEPKCATKTPAIPNRQGTDCFDTGAWANLPDLGMVGSKFWSSTTTYDSLSGATNADYARLADGNIGSAPKKIAGGSSMALWPVRNGPVRVK